MSSFSIPTTKLALSGTPIVKNGSTASQKIKFYIPA